MMKRKLLNLKKHKKKEEKKMLVIISSGQYRSKENVMNSF